MATHHSDDLIESFSQGRLQGAALAAFEIHLLQCEECQAAVRETDLLLDFVRGGSRFMGDWQLIKAVLPGTNIRNIGILLTGYPDRLHSRFRRDFEEFAGPEAGWLRQLAADLPEKGKELGARKSLEWLQSVFAGKVRISKLEHVLVEDAANTVDALYAKHIRPVILPFRTHLPQYSLEAAAGHFSEGRAVEREGWVEVSADIPLARDMFVAHVKGHSMEPRIPDVCLCAFRSKVAGSLDGKVLLIAHNSEQGGPGYAVKLCHSSPAGDPKEPSGDARLHPQMLLGSANPTYKSSEVLMDRSIRVVGEFVAVVSTRSTPKRLRSRTGPAGLDRKRDIVNIVARYDEHWWNRSPLWKREPALCSICAEQDQKAIGIPSSWKEGRTPSLSKIAVDLRGWVDALELGFKGLVINQIDYNLERTLRQAEQKIALDNAPRPSQREGRILAGTGRKEAAGK